MELKTFLSDMGQVPQAYQKASGAITEYNNRLKNGKPTEQYIQGLEKKDKVFGEWIKSLNGSEASMEGYNAHLEKMGAKSALAEAGMTALTGALNMGVMALAEIALQAIASAIDSMIHAQENAIKKGEQITSQWEEQRNALQNNRSTIFDIVSDYEILAQGVDNLGRNISLNTEEYQRYNQIVNQIADMFPQLVVGYTEEGNAILAHKGNVEELTQAYKDQIQASKDAILLGANDAWKGFSAKNLEGSFLQDYSAYDEYNALKKIQSTPIDKIGFQVWNDPISASALQNRAHIDYGLSDAFNFDVTKVQNQIKDGKDNIEAAIRTMEREFDLEVAKIKPSIDVIMEMNPKFEKLTPKVQSAVQQMVDAIDFDFLVTNNITDPNNLNQWLDTKLLSMFEGANGQKVAAAFSKMLDLKDSLDSNEISVEEYLDKLKDFFDTGNFTEENKSLLEKLFGVDVGDEKIENMVSKVQGMVRDEFKDQVGELSIEDLRFAYELENVGDLSFDDLMVEILKLKNAAREPISLGDSVSGLVSEFDELKNAMDKVNEGQTLSLNEITSLLQKYPDLEKSLIKTKDGYTLQKGALDTLYESKLADKRLDIEQSAIQAKAVLDSSNIISGAKNMETDAVITTLKAKIAEKSFDIGQTAAFAYHTGATFDPNSVAADQEELDKMLTLLQTLENSVADSKGLDFYLNYGGGGGSGGSHPDIDTSAKSQPTVSDEFTKAKAVLDDQRARDLIDEQEYYDKRLALYEKYVKGKAGLEDLEKSELKDLDQLKKNLNQDIIDSYDDEIDKLKNVEGSEDERYRLVQEKKAAIEKIMAEAREAGKSETSEYYKSLISMLEDTVEQAEDILEKKRENEQKAFLEDIDASKDRIASYKDRDQGEISGELMVEEADAAMKAINDRIEKLRGEDSEANKEYIKELQKQYQELYDSRLEGLQMILDAEKKQIDESISAAREALEKERKATEEFHNEEIKAYKRKHEAQEKVNTLKEKELQLENLKKQRNVLTYMEGQGFVYTADTEAVEAAQEDLDKTREEYEYQAQLQRMEDAKEKALKAIDDELAKLNEQQEFWDRYFEDFDLNSKTAQDIHEDWVKKQGEKFVEQTQAVTNYADTYTAQLERMIEKIRELNALESGRELKGELKSGASSGKGKGYASGSAYVSNSGTYLVNENGPEAIFKPGTGTYEYLPQGTVVFSAAATKNLWNWSKLSPAHAFRSSHLPSIAVPQVSSINIGDVILNGVQDTDRLSREIVDRLPLALQQEFYKR